MSSYTMELRTIIEQATQDTPDLTHRERIEIGRGKLFDFPYPIFDEAYRNVFETNFIRNFYTREIGFETEGLFKFKLDTWLNINMPYFNKLFASELIEFDPLESYSLKTTYQKKNDVIQNDTLNKNFSENNQLTGNEQGTGSQSSATDVNSNNGRTFNEDNENTSKQNTETTDLSKTETENQNESETTSETLGKDSSFNRKLESNTPDTRLSITPNEDGTGVINYASNIEENKNTGENESTNDTKSISTDTGTSETNTDTSSQTTGETKGNIKQNEEMTTTSNENTSSSFNDSRNKSETGERRGNESNVGSSKINDIEDYIETKVGSIGVKTYSEMIQEYRSILLRIEKQIFEEMNELFMLVY